MMPERDLANPVFDGDAVERAAAQVGTEGAGIFFPAYFENYFVYFLFGNDKLRFGLLAEAAYRRNVGTGKPRVKRDGGHGEMLRMEFRKQSQCAKQRQTVLAAAHAYRNTFAFTYHIIFVDCPPHKSDERLYR